VKGLVKLNKGHYGSVRNAHRRGFWEEACCSIFIPEYRLIKRANDSGQGLADAVSLPDELNKKEKWQNFSMV
jgi:hypothetical protein